MPFDCKDETIEGMDPIDITKGSVTVGETLFALEVIDCEEICCRCPLVLFTYVGYEDMGAIDELTSD